MSEEAMIAAATSGNKSPIRILSQTRYLFHQPAPKRNNIAQELAKCGNHEPLEDLIAHLPPDKTLELFTARNQDGFTISTLIDEIIKLHNNGKHKELARDYYFHDTWSTSRCEVNGADEEMDCKCERCEEYMDMMRWLMGLDRVKLAVNTFLKESKSCQ